jgi:hypothetical protein
MHPAAAAGPAWNRVDTPNFVVIGTAGEKSLTDTGLQFEGFREGLSRILSKTATASAVPTVVIVFPSDKTFEPFRPVYNGKRVELAGLFLPRQDVNYVLLGPGNSDDAWRVVFHEYTHLIINNVVPNLPPWLNEGLAEYYSSFQIGHGGRQVVIGKPIASHYRTLDQEPWLSIPELIATTHESPQYNEGSRRSVFYAESWLLTHMLINGQPDRKARLGAYVDAFESHVSMDASAAWDKAFGAENIGAALKQYATRPTVTMTQYTLSDQIARASGVRVAFAPADVEATFGDLCLAVGDKACAGERFQRALALNPSSARAAIGLAEASARAYSARPAPSDDWFTEYMTAAALVHGTVGGRAEASAAASLLEHAAQQHPVANMFGLIAEAVGDGAISAADIEGLRQAHASAPARDDYAFALARALAAKGYYADAREVLGSLMAHPHWQDSHEEAMRMMRWVVEREQRVTAANSHPESPESKPADTATAGATEPATAAQVEEDPPDRAVQPVYRDVLKGEERAEGLLERVDCDPGKPATLTVRYGSRVQQYQAPRLTDIQFITYRSRKAGRFTCGPRVPPDRIYLTWKRGTDGVETPVAVEFLPVK